MPKYIIRYIYWMIFELHPVQVWHNRVFEEIVASERKIWRLCIPPGHGKSYMIDRLRGYYQMHYPTLSIKYVHGPHRDRLRRLAEGANIVIECESVDFNRIHNKESVAGFSIEYRKLETDERNKRELALVLNMIDTDRREGKTQCTPFCISIGNTVRQWLKKLGYTAIISPDNWYQDIITWDQ